MLNSSLKPTLVIGASPDPSRTSWVGVRKLKQNGIPVQALGVRAGEIEGIPILTSSENVDKSQIHTISLYLNPQIQKEYYSQILAWKPKRIYFNPGAENSELLQLASENGIECIEACMLVELSVGAF